MATFITMTQKLSSILFDQHNIVKNFKNYIALLLGSFKTDGYDDDKIIQIFNSESYDYYPLDSLEKTNVLKTYFLEYFPNIMNEFPVKRPVIKK